MFSLDCDCLAVFSSGRFRPGGLRMAQTVCLPLFPTRLFCRVFPSSTFSLQCQKECRVRRGQQWRQKRHQHKSQKGQTHARSLPWTHHAVSYLRPGPARAPLPSQECCRIATFSSTGPTLLFSGRLGGGRGTGSDHWR